MSFRARLFLALTLSVLVPLAALAWGMRREMDRRLTAQYEQRVAAMAAILEADLVEQRQAIGTRLASLAEALARDNRFRLAVQGSESERSYRLDYASHAMRMAGLSVLQIQDADGRILSSGHFRNEYDRLEPELPRLLSSTHAGTALVQARRPEGPLLALVRVDSLRIHHRSFTIVGGVGVEQRFLERLTRDRELSVFLIYPGGLLAAGAGSGSGPEESLAGDGIPPAGLASAGSAESTAAAPGLAEGKVVAALELPFIAATPAGDRELRSARVLLTQSLAGLVALRRQLDTWFAAVAGATLLLALMTAAALSTRISRPLAELARRTEEIDLERLDVEFASGRKDEIGALSRLLGAMTQRLRASARRLRDAERRAAIGELARQVNHDIKNGLVPIRNVLRHLSQAAEEQPERLAEILHERKATLDSGLAYLENLAANYARLTPRPDVRPCDVNAAVREVVRDAGREVVDLRLRLAGRLPAVRCDPVALRRVMENLLTNAFESLEAGRGTVTVSTAELEGGGVRIQVADSGRGMTAGEAERAFDDFYTTKPGGTGLGLSIVRRLVRDAGGDVRVETESGAGARFIVDLPPASGGGDSLAGSRHQRGDVDPLREEAARRARMGDGRGEME